MNCVPDAVAAAFIAGMLSTLAFVLLANWLVSKLTGED